MKKFRLTYTVTREFTVPDTATDEEYDAMKETVMEGLGTDMDADAVKVELIDAPDEIKEKYIINRECQD
jgi:hypothetical protein